MKWIKRNWIIISLLSVAAVLITIGLLGRPPKEPPVTQNPTIKDSVAVPDQGSQSYAKSGVKVTVKRTPKRVETDTKTDTPNSNVGNDDVVIEIETTAEANTASTRHDAPSGALIPSANKVSSETVSPVKEGKFSVGVGANIDLAGDVGAHANLGYRFKPLVLVAGVFVDQQLDYGLQVGAEFRLYKKIHLLTAYGSGGKIMGGLSWRID